MDRLAKVDKDALARRMRAAFERTMSEVMSAVNDAPDGHLIDGSEEPVPGRAGRVQTPGVRGGGADAGRGDRGRPGFFPRRAGRGTGWRPGRC